MVKNTRFIVTMSIWFSSSIFLPLRLISGEQYLILLGIATSIFGLTKAVDGLKKNNHI
jgi:hypothetical protein